MKEGILRIEFDGYGRIVRLYYGSLTTFSIGFCYIFLLRVHVGREGEEETKKKVSTTTGFITRQLMMFIKME